MLRRGEQSGWRACGLIAALIVGVAPVRAWEWLDVPPEQLARTAPKVEASADAEAIFWKVRLEPNFSKRKASPTFDRYLRIKVYTEKGAQEQATVELAALGRKSTISDIAGRTVLPDGTIVPLGASQILDTDVLRGRYVRVAGKSFALPQVAPGAIIEYRWLETWRGLRTNAIPLQFQRTIPCWLTEYSVRGKDKKPDLFKRQLYTHSFNMHDVPLQRGPDGDRTLSMRNVPAFRAEPLMPPRSAVQPWVLVYTNVGFYEPGWVYWNAVGRSYGSALASLAKVDATVSATAARLVAGIDDDEEAVRKLLEFCRNEIENTDDPEAELIGSDMAQVSKNRRPAHTLMRRSGDSRDVLMLFAALAEATGFAPRLALISGRDRFVFEPELPNQYMITGTAVAIRLDSGWRFFDPSAAHTSGGMLPWYFEGVEAVLVNEYGAETAPTQLSEPQRSQVRRNGTFRLSPEGELSGDVQLIYTGHLAYDRRRRDSGFSVESIGKTVEKQVQKRFPGAKVQDFEVGAVDELGAALRHSYTVTVPRYAQRSATRVIFPVSYFEARVEPLFTASERRYDVQFDFAWMEFDHVSIELPDGYKVDTPAAPAPLRIGAVGAFEPRLSIDKSGRTVYYTSKFEMGRGGRITIPSGEYEHLKRAFDHVHTAGQHLLAAKRAADGKGIP